MDDAHARALRDILSDANLRQNVTDATHHRGNILDLIITSTSSSSISGIARGGAGVRTHPPKFS